jgi:hypothetical protein
MFGFDVVRLVMVYVFAISVEILRLYGLFVVCEKSLNRTAY